MDYITIAIFIAGVCFGVLITLGLAELIPLGSDDLAARGEEDKP